MPLPKDLREFIESFNSNEVEYLIVGAYAVAYHGYPRYTADLDILVRPSADNAARICRALDQFGFGGLGITAADLTAPDQIVQLGVKPNRIDLITSISGVSFDEAWASSEQADLDGIGSRFIGRSALIQNKESTGRAKDLGDAAELRRRGKSRDRV